MKDIKKFENFGDNKSKFVLYMKQRGEGCDYTIGCAMNVIFMKSDNIDDAKEEARQTLEDYGSHRGSETELTDFLIIEVCETYDFLNEFYDEIDEETQSRKKAEIEAKELAEFKRLQNKFDK